MLTVPTITTDRLILRPLTVTDAPDIQRLLASREIALNTLTIPHPYPEGAAEAWIARQTGKQEKDEGVVFAITRREDGALMGDIGLMTDFANERAEIGYWIGVPYWGNGYATEATRALIAYAFDELGLNRVYAYHFAGNPASGRVMEKAGMRLEGELRGHQRKGDEYRDSRLYGIIRSDR
jgi:[ribosomal protein S5]-alanine N-acetyltransferase